MTNLSNTAKKDIRQSTDRIEDAANDTARKVREVAKDTGESVRHFLDEKSEQAAELRKSAEEKIVENPMKSVAIAALGGLVLGALLRR